MTTTRLWNWGLSRIAKRQLKSYRKEKQLVAALLSAIEEVCLDPYRGSPKHGDLQGLWGWHVKHAGSTYCIAYSINEKENFVRVLLIGPHEGFYAQLKRYIRN